MNDNTILAVLGGGNGAARKPPPETDEWRPAAARKDKVRWCKGHVGREHQPIVELDHTLKGFTGCTERRTDRRDPNSLVWHCIHTTVCGVCGKILDLLGSRTHCPDRPAGMPYDFWKSGLNDPASPAPAAAG